MAILLTLHTEVIRRGVWCLSCHMHSGVTVRLYSLCELGVFPGTTRTICARCKQTT